jgi:hypothetical protein
VPPERDELSGVNHLRFPTDPRFILPNVVDGRPSGESPKFPADDGWDKINDGDPSFQQKHQAVH